MFEYRPPFLECADSRTLGEGSEPLVWRNMEDSTSGEFIPLRKQTQHGIELAELIKDQRNYLYTLNSQ